MRVLHVINSLRPGGTERMLINILKRLSDAPNQEHFVVTMRGAGPLAFELPENVPCVSLGIKNRKLAALQLRASIRHWKITLVHARNRGCWIDSWLAARLSRVPALLGFCGWDEDTAFAPQWEQRIRWLGRLGARFSSVSQAGITNLGECGISRERIHYLPNGIDSVLRSEKEAAVGRESMGVNDEHIVAACVGSLTPLKNHIGLIRAFGAAHKLHADARLIIAGDGPMKNTLCSEVRRLCLTQAVIFLGHRHDVAEILSLCDVFVCSSIAEGMSNAILEAMAAGLPILATDVGDNARLVRDGLDGRICSTSETEIAKCLATLIQNEELRECMGNSARQRSRTFDLDNAAKGYESLYRALSKATRGANQVVDSARGRKLNPRDWVMKPIGLS